MPWLLTWTLETVSPRLLRRFSPFVFQKGVAWRLKAAEKATATTPGLGLPKPRTFVILTKFPSSSFTRPSLDIDCFANAITFSASPWLQAAAKAEGKKQRDGLLVVETTTKLDASSTSAATHNKTFIRETLSDNGFGSEEANKPGQEATIFWMIFCYLLALSSAGLTQKQAGLIQTWADLTQKESNSTPAESNLTQQLWGYYARTFPTSPNNDNDP